jgi:hypothetical protein
MVIKAVVVPLLKAQTKAGTAVLLMGQEMRIIGGQFKRIRDSQKNLSLEPDPAQGVQGIGARMSHADYFDSLAMLFGDIYFLIISLWRMWRLFERARKNLPNEPELEAIAARYRALFEEVRWFRNRMEHIDGMVETGITGLGDVRASSFGFDGRSFDYGPALEDKVRAFYEEVKKNHEIIAKRKGLRPFETVQGQMKV